MRCSFLLLLLASLPACTSLPNTPPPLASMAEPLALQTEPDDEAARRQLPAGSFSGLYLRSAWFQEPLEPDQEPDALEIVKIVENSPAAASGLRTGDLLLTVRVATAATAAAAAQRLQWPSQWRKLEVETPPGTRLALAYDRANTEFSAELTLAPRLLPPKRTETERFRAEQRAGIVVRTATEVEARRAGLAAGGGAVLVGMSDNSPWRAAGLRFGDLLVAIDGTPIHHPHVLLGAIREAEDGAVLRVGFRRGTDTTTNVEVPTTRRAREVTSFHLIPLLSYESSRGRTEFSLLFGLIGYESTKTAAEYTFLWLLSWRTGDSDRLVEVDR